MRKILQKISQLVFELKGPKNMWKEPGNSTTMFSTAFEIFHDKGLFYIEVHLWLLGFQIFELIAGKKQ